MEIVRHFLGLCEDNHSHLDLLDIILLGSPFLVYLEYKFKRLRMLITYIFSKKNK